VLDDHTKLMVTRLGTRLRAAGIAEIGGYGRNPDSNRCFYISAATAALFPHAADYGAIEYWTGLRPMTPDGSPYLGATPIANLFLNAGHGSNGWTQACGSARVVADIIAGRKPDIDLAGLTIFNRHARA
jgi:D-amino-acid dehydrogenase